MTIARKCALAALLSLGALAAPGAAAANSATLQVQLTDTSQARLLAGKSVPVRVRSDRAGLFRVTAAARATGAGGRDRTVAASRVLTFRRAGSKRTTLALTPAGHRALSSCDGRRLVVGAGGVVDSDLLTIDRGACRKQATADVDTANADRCDFLDKSACLHPWPNDHFTREDRDTPTRKRIAMNRLSMPANVAGVPIDPTDMNRADGFSPGNLIVTHVPGLDNQQAFDRTAPVTVDNLGAYDDPGQPVVVINARTRRRHLVWAEHDVNAKQPEDANLIIRPGVNWDEGGRYIVALRRLKDRDGNPIEAQAEFRAYRDRQRTSDPAFEARRKHMEDLMRTLRRAGIERDDLYLAWDFTVASERSLAGRMLQIRDDAFAKLGDTDLSDLTVQGSAPAFVVDTVENLTPQQDSNIGRRVKGRVVVPCYLNAPGCPPGSRFLFAGPGDDTPRAVPGNVMLAEFDCRIPRQQTDGDAPPARPSLYGHGLLGTAGEVGAGNVRAMAQEHNFVFCATPWAGMSQEDVPNVASILADLSHFNSLADRAQQGMLNFLYLGRLMIHPQGFNAHPAFQVGTVPHGAIDTTRLFYDGNSQGGIMGGSLTAVAPDFDHAVLGVPGMNYSTLLRRSVDFDRYAQVMYETYPDEGERPLVLSLIQLLWDRGEANGYAHHITGDPLPGTPPHKVLMHVAFGDHQVTNIAADVEARTIGAAVHDPALDPGRSFEREPLFGIARFAAFPFGGSAMTYFDTGPIRPGADDGTATPPTSETPPRPPEYGDDPHGAPRSTVHGRLQKSEFLKVGGQVVDVCGGRPCYAGSWTGP
jgi:hypothetical protein